jgi:RND family efflux transporter MFP subunit
MRFRVLALVAAAAVVTSGCSRGAPQKQGPPPLAVDVATASQRDIATYISLDGQIAPVLDSTLSSPQSGTIATVLVNEGDRVTPGQLLAHLDDSALRAQLAANEAAVAESQAHLSSTSLQAPISSQQYSSAVDQAQQAVQQAQNRIATDRAALKNAQLVYNSNQQLVGQGYVSQTAAEQARATYVAAQQELNNAMQALPAAQSALRTAQTNTRQTGVDQANIQANQAALATAEANVKLLQTQISQSAVYAPFAGIVTQRLLDPGAFEGPNQPIVRVSQLETVYINCNVPDDQLGFVRPGTPATFTASSFPGRTFSGVVADVNAVPTSGTLSYRARIRQPNPSGELRGGMLVNVKIRKEFHKDAIVVPRTAIFETDQGSNVFTVVDGKAKLLPVQIGLQTDTLTEVRGPGVRPGTTIITTRPDALQDGSVVAVNTSAPPGAAAPKAH